MLPLQKPAGQLELVALLGAGDAEIPVLAELHANRDVHLVGLYDPDPDAVGHDLAEILGLRHGHEEAFLDHLASAQVVVLPRDRHRFGPVIERLRQMGVEFLPLDEALSRYAPERVQEHPLPPQLAARSEEELRHLEQSLSWLQRTLDSEELLRSMLRIAVQAVGGDHGSVQLLDGSDELYIAYAEGLSDHTIKNSRQRLGEGIAGAVAKDRRARLIQGGNDEMGPRDRPDIQSAACTPLLRDGEVAGVLNVSTDLGGRQLTPADLERVVQLSLRMGPALERLLEVQLLRDRVLVEELSRELDRLAQLDLGLEHSLALARDLLQDISGAHRGELVVLAPDGPALHLQAGYADDGAPLVGRDTDPSRGIIAQVLLSGMPVVMEERLRAAGSHLTRRLSRLYLPLGAPDSYALFILGFEGLSALRHFQRSIDRVVEVLTPRVGELIARRASEGRMERLQQLAGGLSRLAGLPADERAGMAATLFMQVSQASAVALWLEPGPEPTLVLQASGLREEIPDELWAKLHERIAGRPRQRVREADPGGSELRSVLLASGDGPLAIAAVNRVAEGPMDEMGFREEDLEAAALLVETLRPQERSPEPEPAPAPPAARSSYEASARLLLDALERELVRAQRYHSAFSVTCFDVGVGPEGRPALREAVEHSARATDCVVWIGPSRFAILAPEEARGQRLLARRFAQVLRDFLREQAGGGGPEGGVKVGSASYPQDAEEARALLHHCLLQLEPSRN